MIEIYRRVYRADKILWNVCIGHHLKLLVFLLIFLDYSWTIMLSPLPYNITTTYGVRTTYLLRIIL